MARFVLLNSIPAVKNYAWTILASKQCINTSIHLFLFYFHYMQSDQDGDIMVFKFTTG